MSELPSSSPSNHYPNTAKRCQVNDNSEKAKKFASWYKHMIDNDRSNLGMYLSDDAILEWFGRTVKTRKKVSLFMKHEMQCSKHNFVSIQSIDKIQNRHEIAQRKEEINLSYPNSPELIESKKERKCRKRVFISDCGSPEWADGCGHQKNIHTIETKKIKSNDFEIIDRQNDDCQQNGVKRSYNSEDSDCNSKGDGAVDRKVKRKSILATPPNWELGQGDCLPSTSSAASDMSHEALNAQLPKVYLECNGFIKFIRTRNGNSMDAINWERKCKIQISYSEDPLNVGEYIIWAVHYSDESKCRRNLLAAFEEVAMEDADS
ncbi:hypothetical protein ACJJTC_010429 [Scirpophaga incertulas]